MLKVKAYAEIVVATLMLQSEVEQHCQSSVSNIVSLNLSKFAALLSV